MGVFLSIVNGYKVHNNPPTDLDEKKLFRCNSKSLHTIMVGLSRTINSKVISSTISKEVWDKLKALYEGDDKVKKFKFQKV